MKSQMPEVKILGVMTTAFAEILTPEAINFIVGLHKRCEMPRRALLAKRAERQKRIDAGELPGFLTATEWLRKDGWRAAPVSQELECRLVEITGPASSAKMVINALNSGANVFMADSEDSESPTWENILWGQINLRAASRGTISYASPEGKVYALNDKTAVLMYRPRGWHLLEKHMTINGEPVSAAIFDLGLYFYHNAQALLNRGSGPYFYFPKMESHLEARLLNDVIVEMQDRMGILWGTTKVTPLIETILAAFEMDEIIYELRDHIAGLNCGRWDYIFSFIKKFRNHSQLVLPDRAKLTMDKGFLANYVKLLIETCHRRGIHAMGGMAAQIPIKGNAAANEEALEKVESDKEREVIAGHDGTWVAHPGLVSLAKAIFERGLDGAPNQKNYAPEEAIDSSDLLAIIDGSITEAGLRTNVRVSIEYLESWLRGIGCVPIDNKMEDAATVEISRSQIWQWIRHEAKLDDGRVVTRELVAGVISAELQKIKDRLGEQKFADSRCVLAGQIFIDLVTAQEFPEFLTLAAYEHI